MDLEPEQLRELFDGLKRADGPRAPSFERTWQSAQARQCCKPRRRRAAAWTMVATTLLTLGVWGAYAGWKHGRYTIADAGGGPAPQEVVSQALVSALWDWRSPTESLLDSPDLALASGPELDWRSIWQDRSFNN